MTPEQRQELIRLLEQGEEISPEWARILFPPEKREYELVYHCKEGEADILANTLAVPLQPVRTFGKNSLGLPAGIGRAISWNGVSGQPRRSQPRPIEIGLLSELTAVTRFETVIPLIRKQKVLLDADLAALKGVETKVLVKAVKRNAERFPADFKFQRLPKEITRLMFQIGTSKAGRGGRRYAPTPSPNKASPCSPACHGTGWITCSHEVPPAPHGEWWPISIPLCTDRDHSKVELDHGQVVRTKNLDWRRIKPLIWW
jgi:hypothetical protein